MASEDMPNFQFCIDLTDVAVVQQVTISLDPMPGTASGKITPMFVVISNPSQYSHSLASDFSDATVTLTFPAGTVPGSSQCGGIAITDDSLVELQESFQVLATPSHGFIEGQATATATVNIVDNDGMKLI